MRRRDRERSAGPAPPVAALLIAVSLAGCTRPLPEEGSQAAVLYEQRCGTCHRPYHPTATKFATWEMILPRMEQRMAEARRPPLTPAERQAIREYLRRHSG